MEMNRAYGFASLCVMRFPQNRTPAPWLRLTALSLLVLGCNSARREALERVEAARLRGDHQAEALARRDACRADADDAELCAAASAAARVAVDDALAKAGPLCAAGDVDGCLNEARAARALSAAANV